MVNVKGIMTPRLRSLSMGQQWAGPGDWLDPAGFGANVTSKKYRVYFKKRGQELIILLGGGEKSSQPKDIKTALHLARHLSE